jgi:hypothetical protein
MLKSPGDLLVLESADMEALDSWALVGRRVKIKAKRAREADWELII